MTEVERIASAAEPVSYRDATAPVEARVSDLLSRMTTEEKLAQLGSVWAFELLDGEGLDVTIARARLRHGIGQITRVAGSTNLDIAGAAALANGIQRVLVEETRLGIPAIVHEECLHGVLARDAVWFPQSLGQAATWDPSLVEAMTRSIGRQLRLAGAHQGLAPILDVARDARWGRIEETYGEDPYLVAEMGTAYARGLQGAGSLAEGGVIATAKHLVGHGLPEGGRNQGPTHLGIRELRDVYLFPFEAAIRSAGVRSVMHAYDDLDGVPCVASRELLTTTLREEWGFDGIVVADYNGIEQLVTHHRMVTGLPEAAALALDAGVDVELPTTVAYGNPLARALADGLVEPDLVERSVARILRVKFELGLFERPYVEPALARRAPEADRALAREIATRSIVLLKNDGILPLRENYRTIAVIGPNAESARNLLGDYSHVAHIQTLLEIRGGANPFGGPLPHHLELDEELTGRRTILDAIKERVASTTRVRFAAGCGVLDGDDEQIQEAVAVARDADVAILVVGERSGLTADCTCGEFRDRLVLSLPGRQEELVAAVAATGTPIVLVLLSGRPLSVEAAAERSAAVVMAWVPGEEGPAAVSATLFGDANPGGKLPVTVPRHAGQIPIYYSHKPSGGRSHWWGDYVDGSHLPLWPFGHGLSYTRFELDDLELDRRTLEPDGEVAVSLLVRNVGEREGDEVVQLYVRDPEASVTRPVKELRGFRRVRLAAGQSRRVIFRLATEQLAFTGRSGDLVIEPGRIELMVGTSSEDLPCRAELEIVGGVTLDRRTRYSTQVSTSGD
jgi:beta-glucosidase